MGKIVPFQRKQERSSWRPNKPPLNEWTPNSKRWRRWNFWQVRNLVLAALIGGLAAQYLDKLAPTDTNSLQQLAPSASTSQVTASSVRFELCGQGARTNCVADGDTIWYDSVKIRLASIDAPEIHDYKCSSELALGERSKRRLLELMNAGPFEVVKAGIRDEDNIIPGANLSAKTAVTTSSILGLKSCLDQLGDKSLPISKNKIWSRVI